MTAITKKQGEAAVKSNRRMREEAAERSNRIKLVAGMVGARTGVRVLTMLVPALAGMAPMAEVGGGAYLIWKGIDPATKDSGLKLGIGLGLGVGMVDKVGDFVVNTAAKFKNK